jgi:hypothetical protein
MPTPEHFPWLSAALAVAALALGLPGLVALVLGRRKQAPRRELPPALLMNAKALDRTAVSPQWLGLWDGCPGAWPVNGPGRNERTCPEA